MISNILNNSIGKAGMKLVSGIVLGGLLVGVAYGVVFLSSHSSKGGKVAKVEKAPRTKAFYPIKIEPQEKPEPQQPQPSVTSTTPASSPKTMAAAKPVKPVVEEMEPEETWQGTNDSYANEEEDDSEEIEMRAREIQNLKEALPGNILVPFERTQEETEALLAVSQEINAIKESIDNNTATMEDRQRYFDIVSSQFDDEIELINYCNNMMADPDNNTSIELCKNISTQDDQRIQEIEGLKAELRKQILQEQ